MFGFRFQDCLWTGGFGKCNCDVNAGAISFLSVLIVTDVDG